jgi:hypothetical protein
MTTVRRTALGTGVLVVSALALWPRDLPASVEDQRARLPAAPEATGCADEVSGVWRAHVYYQRLRDWYRYELRVERRGDALTGSIHLRGWTGRPEETEPPPCRPGLRDAEWSEPATGSVSRGANGLTVRFDATSWRLERTHCGSPSGDYALDHFSGLLDERRQEFTSTNTYTFGNGETFADPTLFRRVSCTPRASSESRPRVVVEGVGAQPPPALPSARRRSLFGCGR